MLVLSSCATGSVRQGVGTATHPPASASAPIVEPPDPPSRGLASESPERRLMRTMLASVEAARGLKATKPVPGAFLKRSELIARVKEHVSRELPPKAIHNEGLSLMLFGFVPTSFDYEAAEYQLLEDQLAGYYEPSDRTMYMASDLDQQEATATLAHELVHALQDQRWDLEARSKYTPGDGDRSEAVSALAEGDATSAMFDVMIARVAPGLGKTALDIPDSTFVEQIRDGMTHGPAATAPHIMRSSLAAPYVYGTRFVNLLRRRGGWSSVDRAWDDAPTTSEQILHVEKWLAHERPMHVPAPTFGSLGLGWTVADEDSEGELGARLAFEEWMDPSSAAETSDGWGGDRAVLLSDGERSAFAWRLRFDPGKTRDERAARAYSFLAGAFSKKLGPAQLSDNSFACREREDRGPIALAHVGADIVFTLGPALTTAVHWKSAGTCALARKWTLEIAARD
jgi:hypothetical protein